MVQIPTTKIVKDGAFLVVNASDVAEYVAQGWAVEDGAEAPPAQAPAAAEATQAGSAEEQPGAELEDMKVAELRKLADDLSIEHEGLKKPELIEAIRAVRDGG